MTQAVGFYSIRQKSKRLNGTQGNKNGDETQIENN